MKAVSKLSIVEARKAFIGKRYSKELGREIYRSGYSFAVSSRTGTICEIRPDDVPKGALNKLHEMQESD